MSMPLALTWPMSPPSSPCRVSVDPQRYGRPVSGTPDPVRAIGISLGAGVCGAIQPDLNAALGDRLDSSLLAALVNFLVALTIALAVVARRPGTRHHLATVAAWPAPRWTRAAGLGGALVVLSGVVTVERLGVA